MLYTLGYASPLGPITLASDGRHIIGLWLEGQKYFAATVKGMVEQKSEVPVLAFTGRWLDAYFAGEKPAIGELPLAPSGSDFRKAVWDILCKIPYGQLTTYGEIAKEMASLLNRKSMSSQAVGGAVGHNPISIIIPCHRVVGASGSLTGYAGGIARKIKLLQLEGVDITSLSLPVLKTSAQERKTVNDQQK
ncbi:MAG: methylated-DNA--[protein]-cysteine S-methyltransferase [Desulfopila sp.]